MSNTSKEEMLEMLRQLKEATGDMARQVDILSEQLRAAHEVGVQEGFTKASALFATGSYVGALTPNSFEMSKTSDNPNNSDDLYMNS